MHDVILAITEIYIATTFGVSAIFGEKTRMSKQLETVFGLAVLVTWFIFDVIVSIFTRFGRQHVSDIYPLKYLRSCVVFKFTRFVWEFYPVTRGRKA